MSFQRKFCCLWCHELYFPMISVHPIGAASIQDTVGLLVDIDKEEGRGILKCF